MADDTIKITVPLSFDVKSCPKGSSDYDTDALTRKQQTLINEYNLHLTHENYLYLAAHPELGALIHLIVRKTLIQKPADIFQYISSYFSKPEYEIRKEVKKIIEEQHFEVNEIPLSKYDEWDY